MKTQAEAALPGGYALSLGRPNVKAPNGFRWERLTELSTLLGGHTPSRRSPAYWNGGIPWIGLQDAVDHHGETIFTSYQSISAEGLENSCARLLPAGTVCLSRTASVGYVVQLGQPMATSQDFLNFVCGPSLDPTYLKYIFLAERERLLRFGSGTAHATIYYPDAKALHVLVPSMDKQREIVDAIGTLEAKLDLARRMGKTLDDLIKCIFVGLFVDSASTHEESRGVIPAGWQVLPLSKITAELRRGLEPLYVEEGGICVLNQKCIRDGKVDFSKARRHDVQKRSTRGRELCVGDVLINSTGVGTLGRVGYVDRLSEPTIADSHVTVCRVKPGIVTPHYLFAALRFRESALCGLGEGSTGQTELTRSKIREFLMLVPPYERQLAFGSIAAAVMAQMAANDAEIRSLVALREVVLPPLLLGEVGVGR